nr:right-handed parallel beta-helix repeat-containing protein [uncultured Desulfobacter sp.]
MNLVKKIITFCLLSVVYTQSLWAIGPFPGTLKKKQSINKINPAVVYVNQDSRADSPDGSSWAQAFSSLSTALQSNLIDKKEIWVARGTYYPSDISKREDSFCLVSGISIYGGFIGNEFLRSQRNWTKNVTVLSGEIGDPQLLSDNSYHVVTGADDTLIDGFIIRDGYAVPDEKETVSSDILAGVQEKKTHMKNPDTVTSANVYSGGGLLNLYAGAYVRNCSFQGNYAVKGGAVCNLATQYRDHNDMTNEIGSKTPVFESCIFEDNHAITHGGAVYNAFFTRTTFITCAFTDNTSGSRGGAVYADKGSPVHFMNILFSHNEAERGAALAADGSSNIRLIYATFACNMAYDTGAAIYLGSCLNKQTDGSPFIGNEAHLYKSLIISNVSITSPSSISSQHDSTVTFDEQSIVETVDGTMNASQFLVEKSFASKSAEAGFHPARKIDVDCWTDIFDGDENRMYLSYDYDTSSASGNPGTIYVNDDASAGGDGTSWATAFCDLNLALEQAAAGSRIWVAKGVYTPTDGPERFATFVMKKGVDIYGGFNGNETTLNERDWETNKTVLSGDIGRVGDDSDNSYHVVFGASDSLLDGFIVQAGRADGEFYHRRGGGLLCDGKASPRIANCIFEKNQAEEGGAIAGTGSASPVLENCTITENTARLGGGILFRTRPGNPGPGAKLTDVKLTGNTSQGKGGAVYIDSGAQPCFTRCTLSGNRSLGNGGSVYVDNSTTGQIYATPHFNACFLTDNTTGLRGGAFAVFNGTVSLKDTVVTHNTAVSGGGGIALDYRGALFDEKNTSVIEDNISTSGKPDIDNATSNFVYEPNLYSGR